MKTELTLKEKGDVLKGFWFVEATSKSTDGEHLFFILPTKKEAEDKVEKLKKIYNPHPNGKYFDYVFFIGTNIVFDWELSGQI